MNLTMPWNKKQSTKGWTAPIDEVKQQIGQQIDHLAQAAAHVGRDVAQGAANISQGAASVSLDAGTQAAGAARDLGTQAVRATQGAGTQAVSVVRDVPTGASSLAQLAMRGVEHIARDLRSIRVAREPVPAPKQRGPDIMPGVALLAGVGGGLALMFFLDPDRGRRRRILLRDQLTKWTRIGRQSAAGKAKDVRNRTVGVMHEARKAVVPQTGAGSNESDAVANETQSYSTSTNANGQGSDYGTPEDSTQRAVEQPIS